jgi:hypothetical protein
MNGVHWIGACVMDIGTDMDLDRIAKTTIGIWLIELNLIYDRTLEPKRFFIAMTLILPPILMISSHVGALVVLGILWIFALYIFRALPPRQA